MDIDAHNFVVPGNGIRVARANRKQQQIKFHCEQKWKSFSENWKCGRSRAKVKIYIQIYYAMSQRTKFIINTSGNNNKIIQKVVQVESLTWKPYTYRKL